MIDLLFEASIADVLDDHISDERLKTALFGQGIIGTWGGPRDPGTASIKLMHFQGDMDGRGPLWGYVEGGMGMVSFAIADAAREAGAVLACGVPVSEILPGEGVTLEDGTSIRAAHRDLERRSEADALAMLDGQEVDAGFRDRLERWKVRSPVVKFNAALDRLPDWAAAPGEDWPARATIDVTGHDRRGPARLRGCGARRARGRVRRDLHPDRLRPIARAARESTCLASSASTRPTSWRTGTWDARRDEVARQFIDLIDRFAPGFEDCLVDHEVLGPPDIESRIGLTGGNIFQGEVTPGSDVGGPARRRAPRCPASTCAGPPPIPRAA